MTELAEKIARAKRAGIQRAELTWDACQEEKVPFFVACAFLMQESSGGYNVWGQDPTWMIRYPVMNEDTYAVYRKHRSKFGAQGVGPMQLTYPALQDQADELGGCWIPGHNMRVGFRLLAEYKRDAPTLDGKSKWWWAAKKYNSGNYTATTAGRTYADETWLLITDFRRIIQDGR